jgi:hypothetical protein
MFENRRRIGAKGRRPEIQSFILHEVTFGGARELQDSYSKLPGADRIVITWIRSQSTLNHFRNPARAAESLATPSIRISLRKLSGIDLTAQPHRLGFAERCAPKPDKAMNRRTAASP